MCLSVKEMKDYRPRSESPGRNNLKIQPDKFSQKRGRHQGCQPRGRHWDRRWDHVNTVSQDEESQDNFETVTFDTICIDAVCHRTSEFSTIDIKVSQKEKHLKGKIDTGAEGNVLPFVHTGLCFQNSWIIKKPSTARLLLLNGTVIKQYGTVIIQRSEWWMDSHGFFHRWYLRTSDIRSSNMWRHESRYYKLCYETQTGTPAVQPITTCDELRSYYPDRFRGIGLFPGT